MNMLPTEMIEQITTHLDIYTIPHFKATCKVADNAIGKEQYVAMVAKDMQRRFNLVVDVVRNYHNNVSQDTIQTQLSTELLKSLYQKFGAPDPASEEKQLIWSVIDRMFNHTMRETGCDFDDMVYTWVYHINNEPLTDDIHLEVLSVFKKFLVGPTNYSLVFEHVDAESKSARYYSRIEFIFDANNALKLCFHMQDMKEDAYIWDGENQIGLIPGASINIDGDIVMDVNDDTLYGLSLFIIKVFGVQVYMFETSMVSTIKQLSGCSLSTYAAELYETTLNQFVNAELFREMIVDIFE